MLVNRGGPQDGGEYYPDSAPAGDYQPIDFEGFMKRLDQAAAAPSLRAHMAVYWGKAPKDIMGHHLRKPTRPVRMMANPVESAASITEQTYHAEHEDAKARRLGNYILKSMVSLAALGAVYTGFQPQIDSFFRNQLGF